MSDINESADRIARAAWETYISTGAFTLSGLREAVFKELAADDARQAPQQEKLEKVYQGALASAIDTAMGKLPPPAIWMGSKWTTEEQEAIKARAAADELDQAHQMIDKLIAGSSEPYVRSATAERIKPEPKPPYFIDSDEPFRLGRSSCPCPDCTAIREHAASKLRIVSKLEAEKGRYDPLTDEWRLT